MWSNPKSAKIRIRLDITETEKFKIFTTGKISSIIPRLNQTPRGLAVSIGLVKLQNPRNRETVSHFQKIVFFKNAISEDNGFQTVALGAFETPTRGRSWGIHLCIPGFRTTTNHRTQGIRKTAFWEIQNLENIFTGQESAIEQHQNQTPRCPAVPIDVVKSQIRENPKSV